MKKRTVHRLLITTVLAIVASLFIVPTTPGLAAERAGDIVFLIDESGSMSNEIDAVKSRIDDVAVTFRDQVDARYALVSFGGNPPGHVKNEPFTRVNLTDQATFSQALSEAGAYVGGGVERGVDATTYAVTGVSGFRAGAAVCVVMISDEEPSYRVDLKTDLGLAIPALQARNAVWFGIVDPAQPGVEDAYGPKPGSLAASTGGAVFSINDFQADATPVLNALISQCADAVVVRASNAVFTATPVSGFAPLSVTFEAEGDGAAVSYAWDFGDGQSGNGAKVTHTYPTPGTYKATLTVTDSSGSTATSSQTISVRERTGAPVVTATDCTIVGTAGDDVLRGTSGDDVICGLGGNDKIFAGKGNDIVDGGPGNDMIKGGAGLDLLSGGPGHDLIKGAGGNDEIRGRGGRDRVFGGAGRDEIYGNGGKDILNGGLGADILYGGAGPDTLRGGKGPDKIYGEGGADRLLGQGGPDQLFALDRRRDIVNGGAGRDRSQHDLNLDSLRSIEGRLT